jgi:hypothetical protein
MDRKICELAREEIEERNCLLAEGTRIENQIVELTYAKGVHEARCKLWYHGLRKKYNLRNLMVKVVDNILYEIEPEEAPHEQQY